MLLAACRILSRVGILHPHKPLGISVDTRQPYRQCVFHERYVEGAAQVDRLEAAGVKLAVAAFDVALHLLGVGRPGRDVVCAAGGVQPVEGALRPAQQFHALHVHEREEGHAHCDLGELVHEHRHALRRCQREGARADAAHANRRRLCAGCEIDPRCQGRRLGEVEDAQAGDFLLTHHGHRDRHVLQVLFGALRRYDDFFETARVGGE